MQVLLNNFNIYNKNYNNKNLNFSSNPHKILNNTNKKALALGLMMLGSINIANINLNKSNSLYAQSMPAAQNPIEEINNSFGKYGKYYTNNIPSGENISEHADSLNQINNLYNKIQGCDFSNPAVLNGMSIEDIKSKVINPAQKLANGEKFGANQNNLIFIIFDSTCDKDGAFDFDLKKNTFNAQKDRLDYLKFDFDESFFQHYDNIIFIQPNNGQTADKTLDTVFSKLEKCIYSTSKTDIFFEGHGYNKTGVKLSTGRYEDKSMMDLSDFNPNNPDNFAKSMRNIMVNSINSGYAPKIIGVGCNSDFMQEAVDKIMPVEYKNKVKVFGSPYDTMQSSSIGYNNGYLELYAYTLPIKDKKGFVIKLTDGNWIKPNNKQVESFLINPDKKGEDNNMFTINQYFTDGTKSGSLSKKSGVVMQYFIMDFSNKNIVY